jgi:hypothetical protein
MRNRLLAGALAAGPVVLLLAGAIQAVPWSVAVMTLLGALGAVTAGLLGGVTARRFLSEESATPHVVFGLGATGIIGTVALGYLYLFFMRYPMASIGSAARTLSQSTLFVDFILAQYAGIVWLYPRLASHFNWQEKSDHA